MKWYVKPKCTHAFILHLFPMIKGFPKVLILHPLGHLMNFQINTWDSLQFKPISNLTMVYYHQNLIRRTFGLTITYIFLVLNYFLKLINLLINPIQNLPWFEIKFIFSNEKYHKYNSLFYFIFKNFLKNINQIVV